MPNPPGPAYLVQHVLPYVIGPSGGVYLLFKTLQDRPELGTPAVPTWAITTLSALAVPGAFVLKRYYKRYLAKKRAAALGAELIPEVVLTGVKGPNVLGIPVMRAVVESFKNGYPAEVFLDWAQTYGNVFQLPFPTDSRIITFEPDHIKAVLATQFENFDKGPIFIGQMGSMLGSGVFNSDGDMWKFHRSMTRPFFTRERISDFEIFDKHAEKSLKIAQSRLSEGHAFDVQDLMGRFTLDSATEFLFGYDVQSLEAGLAYPPTSGKPNSPEFASHPSNAFFNAFVEGQTIIADRTRLGAQWPLAEFWKDTATNHRAIVDGFVEPLLAKALANRKVDEKSTEDETTLLAHLVQHTQDKNILKDELVNLLVAGRDTTATTLTFAFYMLAEHPDIADRLRTEIVSKLGYSRGPTYDDMRELKYLRAFINEVLRLYPPVPFDSRYSTKETVWHSKTADGPKTHYIPPNTRLLYSTIYMQRRTDLWGPDAEEFDPDRFIDERLHKYLTPNPYIFCPFNAGPRICLGQQFAYHEASYFLIRLLQRFTNFSLAPDAMLDEFKPREHWAVKRTGVIAREKIWPSSHLTLYVKGGLWGKMDELKPE